MKKITTVVLLLFTSILLAQHKNVEIKETINTNTDVKIISMSYSVDSAKQLENKTKEIDSLILKSKKYLKALIKISKNYENK